MKSIILKETWFAEIPILRPDFGFGESKSNEIYFGVNEVF
jgi:hypothetical protein